MRTIACITAATAWRKPGEEEHVWIQKRLAPFPPIRRFRVDVEVPENADMEWLQEKFMSEQE
jgi:hypothetical protein